MKQIEAETAEFVLTRNSYGNLVQVPVLTYLVGILRTSLRGARQLQRQ